MTDKQSAKLDSMDAQQEQDRCAQAEGDLVASLNQLKLDSWAGDFLANPTFKLSQLVFTTQSPTAALVARSTRIADPHIFNLQLKGILEKDAEEGDQGEYPPATNQKESGRCWLFAALNILRYRVIQKLNLPADGFELSQSYLFFYDKLEKANWYLENMLDLAEEPLSSRIISFLNLWSSPVNDGGQFDMAVNLLEKYGCCPKSLYPESFSSGESYHLNTLLTSKLKEYSLELRALRTGLQREKGFSREDAMARARLRKDEMVKTIYNTLCIALGTPPNPDEKFLWDYYDADKKAQKLEVSPLELYKSYTGPFLLQDCFSLTNDPRNPYDTHYTVDRLGNIVGGHPIRYINSEISVLEDAVIESIRNDQPVFFGCDTLACLIEDDGIMDVAAYNIEAAYGYRLSMNKVQRLETCDSQANHAMVITAVHLDDAGRPVRYKIENSWSDEKGNKGFYLMTAEWFRQYVYQIVVPKALAGEKQLEVLNSEVVVLPAWDPMGALA